MAKRRNAQDFPLNPALEKFQFEVAQEIGIDTTKIPNNNIDALTKTDQGNGKRNQEQNKPKP
ncbi:MAG: hypothetical protein ACYDG6_00535 [Thermincolia bacterium]